MSQNGYVLSRHRAGARDTLPGFLACCLVGAGLALCLVWGVGTVAADPKPDEMQPPARYPDDQKRRPPSPTTTQPPTDLDSVEIDISGTPSAGRHVTVKVSKPIVTAPQHSAWWLVSKPGSSDEKYEAVLWVDPSQTEFQIPMPESAGDRELRLAIWGADGKLAIVAKRISLEVGPPPTPTHLAQLSVSLDSDAVAVGKPVVVEFNQKLIPEAGEQFWLTLVAPGAAPESYETWRYVPFGAERVELTTAHAGERELRLHAHYPTKDHDIIWRTPVTVGRK